jgi:hypothetical protein
MDNSLDADPPVDADRRRAKQQFRVGESRVRHTGNEKVGAQVNITLHRPPSVEGDCSLTQAVHGVTSTAPSDADDTSAL